MGKLCGIIIAPNVAFHTQHFILVILVISYLERKSFPPLFPSQCASSSFHDLGPHMTL